MRLWYLFFAQLALDQASVFMIFYIIFIERKFSSASSICVTTFNLYFFKFVQHRFRNSFRVEGNWDLFAIRAHLFQVNILLICDKILNQTWFTIKIFASSAFTSWDINNWEIVTLDADRQRLNQCLWIFNHSAFIHCV